MAIQFIPLDNEDSADLFPLFKHYMQPIIAEALGWDETFQRTGFTSRLNWEWFYWIYDHNKKVGLACYCLTKQSLHLHLLLIFTSAQRHGLASQVLHQLSQAASQHSLPLTLNCFKNNQAALALYRKQGFSVQTEDTYFYHLIQFHKNTDAV